MRITSSNDRINNLDQAKGIAILLLLLSHTAPGNLINTWIFIFHMPIFFMIGGILSSKRTNQKFSIKTIKQLIGKRCKNLLLPYVIFCILLSLYYSALAIMNGSEIPIEHFIHTFTFQGVDSMWFIPCYFWAEIISYFIFCLPSRFKVASIALVYIIGITIMTIAKPENHIFFLPEKIIVALMFFITGYIATDYLSGRLSKTTSLITLIICSLLGLAGGFSAIGSLDFPYHAGYLAIATMMSVSLLYLLKVYTNHLNKLNIWGTNSIVILCTNNIIIEIIRLLDYRLTHNFLLSHGLLGSLLLWIILIMIEYILILHMNGPLGILFGRVRGKSN